MSAMEDLDILDDAPPTLIVVPGGDIAVRPLTMGQLPRFSKALVPILEQVESLARGDLDGLQILRLIGDHGDLVTDAVSIATDQPRERIAKLTPDYFMELLGAVISVNKDFFVRRLDQGTLDRVRAVLAGSG